MKIMFVGYAISPDKSFATAGSSAAANRFQLGLLGGLYRRIGGALHVTTRLPAAPWPKSRSLFVHRETEELFPGCTAAILPMLNIPFVKQIWSACAAYAEVGRWARQNRGAGDTAVVGYNLSSLLGVATAWAAVRWKTGFIYLFTDPPYSNTRKGAIWKAAYWANAKMVRYAIGKSRGIVAVNEGAVGLFAPGKPHCIMEGGVEAGADEAPGMAGVWTKTLVYAGGLSPHNGLENLIDGFMRTGDPEYRLMIYGKGVLEHSLKERAAGDGRVEFPGYVSTRQMAAIQRSAAVLVNPRPSGLEICRTTFPSKLMEYLASGRPVLTTRLPGIPPEYGPFLTFIDDETPQGYAGTIDRLLAVGDDTLACLGAAGRKFVMADKNWDVQAGRLLDFVERTVKRS